MDLLAVPKKLTDRDVASKAGWSTIQQRGDGEWFGVPPKNKRLHGISNLTRIPRFTTEYADALTLTPNLTDEQAERCG